MDGMNIAQPYRYITSICRHKGFCTSPLLCPGPFRGVKLDGPYSDCGFVTGSYPLSVDSEPEEQNQVERPSMVTG